MSATVDLQAVRLTPHVVAAGVMGGLAVTSGIALTATSGWLIVRASEQPVILTLLTAIVAVRAFGLLRPLLRHWERLHTHDTALADLARRRSRTYAALVPLTPAHLGRQGRADLLTGVVDDLDDVVSAQVRVTVPVVSALVASGLTTALVAAVHAPTAYVLVSLTLLAAVATWLAYGLERIGLPALLAARSDVAHVSELVAHQATEIRAVGGETAILGRLAGAHDELTRHTLRQARGRALATGLLLAGTGAAVAVVAALWTGSDVPAAVRALLVLTPLALADAFSTLPDAARELARSRAGAERLGSLLDRPRDPRRTLPTSALVDGVPHLRLGGVTANWPGPKDDGANADVGPVDLDIPPGTRLAITGANGSGKSTLLAVLARHLDPATGTYSVNGADVRDLGSEAVRALMAVVDDEPHLFSTTVRENLRLARADATDGDLRDALVRAGLGPWFSGLRDGLDTRIGERGRGLSGGERTRLAIARALLSGRPVLLLDEPTAHLDVTTAREVLDDLTASAGARTVIMVTHRNDATRHVGRVIDLSPTTASTPDTGA